MVPKLGNVTKIFDVQECVNVAIIIITALTCDERVCFSQ